jgi:REP element-mobilizing transposase RayT
MANTYVSSLFHVVFSTKNREPWLRPPIREKLPPYLGGPAKRHRLVALCAGGYTDHVHLLLSIPPDVTVSRALQLVKGASSHWIHEAFPECRSFAWQDGYGAFSIGVSQIDDTRRYIESQPEHHRKVTFQEEYLAFLKRNGVAYDERYVWG